MAAGGPPALRPPQAASELDSDPRPRRSDHPRPKCRAHERHRLPHTVRSGRCITAEESHACWAASGAPTPLARLEIVGGPLPPQAAPPLAKTAPEIQTRPQTDPLQSRRVVEASLRCCGSRSGRSSSRDHRVPRQRSAVAVRAHQAAAADGRWQTGYVAQTTAWSGPGQAVVTTRGTTAWQLGSCKDRRTRKAFHWSPHQHWPMGVDKVVSGWPRLAVTLPELSPRPTQDAAGSWCAAATGLCHADRGSDRGTGGARSSGAAAVGLRQAPPVGLVVISCRRQARGRHVMYLLVARHSTQTS